MESRIKLPVRKRPRTQPNPLRDWLEQHPRPMSKQRFAEMIGVADAYISMLIADNAPWPGRQIIRRIAEVTEGIVDANAMAGYTPKESPDDEG